MCAEASMRWTEGPRLTTMPFVTPNDVTLRVRCSSVAFCVSGSRAVFTRTPANRLTGTKTYAERETVTAGPE
jgi:hypothetical protein